MNTFPCKQYNCWILPKSYLKSNHSIWLLASFRRWTKPPLGMKVSAPWRHSFMTLCASAGGSNWSLPYWHIKGIRRTSARDICEMYVCIRMIDINMYLYTHVYVHKYLICSNCFFCHVISGSDQPYAHLSTHSDQWANTVQKRPSTFVPKYKGEGRHNLCPQQPARTPLGIVYLQTSG